MGGGVAEWWGMGGREIHGKERTGAGDELKLRRARSFRKQVGRRSRW